jgi:hypothetical protein
LRVAEGMLGGGSISKEEPHFMATKMKLEIGELPE